MGDSVVYLSEIQPIQGVIINRKTGLAEMQSQYSHEFEQALKTSQEITVEQMKKTSILVRMLRGVLHVLMPLA